jgi:hypothetical protein
MGGRARPQRARPKRDGGQPDRGRPVVAATPPAAGAAKPKSTFPRRDPDGHVAYFRDLLVAVVVALVVGFIALAVIDAVSGLSGLSGFGSSSGWVSGIIAAWLFVEDFRAWRGTRMRLAIAALAVLVGLGVGGTVAWALAQVLAGDTALVDGMAGVSAAMLVYAPVWFYGIRFVE